MKIERPESPGSKRLRCRAAQRSGRRFMGGRPAAGSCHKCVAFQAPCAPCPLERPLPVAGALHRPLARPAAETAPLAAHQRAMPRRQAPSMADAGDGGAQARCLARPPPWLPAQPSCSLGSPSTAGPVRQGGACARRSAPARPSTRRPPAAAAARLVLRSGVPVATLTPAAIAACLPRRRAAAGRGARVLLLCAARRPHGARRPGRAADGAAARAGSAGRVRRAAVLPRGKPHQA